VKRHCWFSHSFENQKRVGERFLNVVSLQIDELQPMMREDVEDFTFCFVEPLISRNGSE